MRAISEKSHETIINGQSRDNQNNGTYPLTRDVSMKNTVQQPVMWLNKAMSSGVCWYDTTISK